MIHARPDYMRFQDPAVNNPALLGEGSTPIAQDEPVMLFRAKDVFFTEILDVYLGLLSESGSEEHMQQAVRDQIARALKWREKNGAHFPDMPKPCGPRTDGAVALSVEELFLKSLKEVETNEDVYEKIVKYQSRGYKEMRLFPGEYVLLTNPRTMDRVRIYPNGDVWESTMATGGAYVKVLPE